MPWPPAKTPLVCPLQGIPVYFISSRLHVVDAQQKLEQFREQAITLGIRRANTLCTLHTLYGSLREGLFSLCYLQDAFLNRFAAHQTQHSNRAYLAQPMYPSLSLQVNLGVPVRVVHNDLRIGAGSAGHSLF